jgi:hypothetical protein
MSRYQAVSRHPSRQGEQLHLGKFQIDVETSTGKKATEIDEKWLTRERNRIENDYTFTIPRFGRVILSTQREGFDEEIARYRHVVTAYQQAVIRKLEEVKGAFEQKLIDEYLPRWKENPPKTLARYIVEPTPVDIEHHLRGVTKRICAQAIQFAPPSVRVLYVAPESVQDPAFLKPLQSIMERRGVPHTIIASLFTTGNAAPTAAAR